MRLIIDRILPSADIREGRGVSIVPGVHDRKSLCDVNPFMIIMIKETVNDEIGLGKFLNRFHGVLSFESVK